MKKTDLSKNCQIFLNEVRINSLQSYGWTVWDIAPLLIKAKEQALKFLQGIPLSDLPLYINHPHKEVRDILKKRLDGN